MSDDMAERIAAKFNDMDPRMKRWGSMSAEHRAILAARWQRRIEAIRRAGFEVVERESSDER